MTGGAILAKYILNLPWVLAFLYGSLVIVTGPTVIQPLLRRVKAKTSFKKYSGARRSFY